MVETKSRELSKQKKGKKVLYVVLGIVTAVIIAVVLSGSVLLLLAWNYITTYTRPVTNSTHTVTYDKDGIPRTNGMVSYEFANSRPEAHLYYPGAREYSRFGQAERKTGEGVASAIAGAVLISSDPPEKIYTWYHDWLLAHGWQADPHAFGGLGSTQLSLQGYLKKGYGLFYVAMDNPKTLGWVLGKKLPTNITIFEINYEVD